MEIDGEVDAEQHHECADDPLDERAVKSTDAGVIVGKAAGACGAEGMNEGIVYVHAGQQQAYRFRQAENEIQQIQDFRRVPHLGQQLGKGGAGAFGPGQVGRAARQPWQHRQGEHQHAHASDPVGERAPEQHAFRQMLDLCQDRGAGGGKAADGFKISVHHMGNRPGQHKGQRPEKGQDHPAQPCHCHPIPGGEVFPVGLEQEAQQRSRKGRDTDGQQKRGRVAAPIQQRNRQRRDHQPRFHHHQTAQQPEHQFIIQGKQTFFRSGIWKTIL